MGRTGGIACFSFVVSPAWTLAQSRADATLRVTVIDPSGAVIVGAEVTVTASASSGSASVVTPLNGVTAGRGDAVFSALEPGRYAIHVESPGFEPCDANDVRVRARRQPARGEAEDRQARGDGASRPRPARARQRSARRRVRDDPRPGADRRTARRSRRDGAGAARHGRARRDAARQRIPRRPAAAEEPDPVRSASAATCSPPTSTKPGFMSDRHHDQAGHRRLARRDQHQLAQRRRSTPATSFAPTKGDEQLRALRLQR